LVQNDKNALFFIAFSFLGPEGKGDDEQKKSSPRQKEQRCAGDYWWRPRAEDEQQHQQRLLLLLGAAPSPLATAGLPDFPLVGASPPAPAPAPPAAGR
jgi:hypothetical protein